MGKNFDYQAVANTVAGNRTNADLAASLGTFLNTALATYQQHLADKRANELYAQSTAPAATAVLDTQGQPVFDGGGGTPDDEAAHNRALGFGYDTTPNVPDIGGERGLQMRMALTRNQSQVALQQDRAAHLRALLNGGGADPLDVAIKKARLAKLTASPGTTGMTPGQQAVQDRFDTRMAAAALPKPEADSWSKFDAEMKTRYGHGVNEFQDTGAEDTHLVPGGTQYLMGGELGPLGLPTPKQSVILPTQAYEDYRKRYNELSGGTPRILNQAAIDSARAASPVPSAPRAAAGTRQAAGGTVRVVSPNGKKGTIPAAQLEQALADGYKQL